MTPRQRSEIEGAANHGVIERGVALSAGLTEKMVQHLLRTGQWRRLYSNAFVPVGVPVTWKTRLAAVDAWLGDDFLFSHRTAGALLNLDGVPADFIEVVCH